MFQTKKIWTAAEMGRKGGKISRRTLTREQSLEMNKSKTKKRDKNKT